MRGVCRSLTLPPPDIGTMYRIGCRIAPLHLLFFFLCFTLSDHQLTQHSHTLSQLLTIVKTQLVANSLGIGMLILLLAVIRSSGVADHFRSWPLTDAYVCVALAFYTTVHRTNGYYFSLGYCTRRITRVLLYLAYSEWNSTSRGHRTPVLFGAKKVVRTQKKGT